MRHAMNAGRTLPTFLAILCVASAGGCKSDRSEANSAKVLSVFAASSLTEAFHDLERGFETLHPGVDVKLTFAGSQVLRLQIEQGASADVFASANESHMRALIAARHVAGSQVFARNELVVIVPKNNPAGIDAFADLGKASRIVIGTANVPVGIYTRQVLDRAGRELGEAFIDAVKRHIVSEESNVRLVRAKVELGEADAAMIYRTDAAPSDRVRVVSIPSALNVRASYPIGSLTRAPHASEATAFVTYVVSPAGREILARHGFLTDGE
jgi:molybdate transport system substrate-binding protein